MRKILLIFVILLSFTTIASAAPVKIAVLPVDWKKDSEVGRFLGQVLSRNMDDNDHTRNDLGIMGPFTRTIKKELKKQGFEITSDYFDEEKKIKEVADTAPAQYAVYCKVLVTGRLIDNEEGGRKSTYKLYSELVDLTNGRVVEMIKRAGGNYSSGEEIGMGEGTHTAMRVGELIGNESWKAQLVRGKNGRLIIAAGEKSGLAAKQILSVSRQELIYEPWHGQVLTSYAVPAGKVIIESVTDNYAVAKPLDDFTADAPNMVVNK